LEGWVSDLVKHEPDELLHALVPQLPVLLDEELHLEPHVLG
jgi:hypothetical protein